MKKSIKVWVPVWQKKNGGGLFVSQNLETAATRTRKSAIFKFGLPVARATLTLDEPKPKKKGKGKR